MDPTSWPMWVKMLAGWGPLGAWAGIMTWNYVASNRLHHATRTTHEKMLVDQAKRFADVVVALDRANQERIQASLVKSETKLADLSLKSETKLAELSERFADQVAASEARHYERENELTDRLLTASDRANDRIAVVLEKTSTLVDVVKRKGEG